jgi:hypothetical protein
MVCMHVEIFLSVAIHVYITDRTYLVTETLIGILDTCIWYSTETSVYNFQGKKQFWLRFENIYFLTVDRIYIVAA